MTDTPSGTEVATTNDLPPAMIQQFSQMATLIPSEEGDAVENILEAILRASSWEQLDKPWTSSSGAHLEGKVFQVKRIIRRPSRFKDGMGVFLVAHCIDGKTGEAFVWTTSATGVCAQLIVAYARDWLPLWATVIVADHETERGYRPHHLHFYGPDQPGGAS